MSTYYRHWRFLPAVLILREAHELFGKRKANIFSLRSKHTVAPRSAVTREAKSQNTCEDLDYFCSRERDCFLFFFYSFFHVVPLQHNSNVRMRMLELGENPAMYQVRLMWDSSSEFILIDLCLSLFIIYTLCTLVKPAVENTYIYYYYYHYYYYHHHHHHHYNILFFLFIFYWTLCTFFWFFVLYLLRL